jgi:hypothetical protein
MKVRVVYRTCPACGRRFGQPDDPGRVASYVWWKSGRTWAPIDAS